MPTVNKGVERGWISQFDEWIAEIEREGGTVNINSGNRSPEKQADMIKNPSKYGIAPGTPIAKPGQSDHQHGHALDLEMDAKTKAIAKRLAPKYGIRNDIANDPVHWYIPRDGKAKGTYSPGVDLAVGEAHRAPLPLLDRLAVLANALNPDGLRPDTTVDTSTALGNPNPMGGGPTPQPEPEPAAGAPSGGFNGPTRNPGGNSTKQNQALGKQLAARYGWHEGPEWAAFNELVMRESGWNAHAANPTSSARGIAQNIKGYSEDYQEGNAEQQINWMLDYVKDRYGSPSAAIAFHDRKNWY